MKTQVKNLQAKGMKAVYLRDICQTHQPFQDEIVDEEFNSLSIQENPNSIMDIIFSSPESLLGKYRDMVLQLARKGHLKIIFIEEAHCIKKL